MNIHAARVLRSASRVVSVASLIALGACHGDFCAGDDGCFFDDGAQSIAISGTAATGRALAGAAVTIDCVNGVATTQADSSGNYAITVGAVLPCVITATAGTTALHSLAFAGGTFNTTPETDLMLTYLAAQLGTDTAHLLADFPNNAHEQQVLENASNVVAAEAAVASIFQQHYGVALSTQSFLTTPFVVGQPGVDADLAVLAKAGAIDTNGMPDPVAVSLLVQAGAARPL
ncbi:hypothetical protein [Trinickia sp.]|uniref:hypothetical protein n=1 Tax=Trinickia sp. TaxID=2571163 RepID=UPI003F823B43